MDEFLHERHAEGGHLGDQHVAVAVDHEAGKAVGFAVDGPVARGIRVEHGPFGVRPRRANEPLEEFRSGSFPEGPSGRTAMRDLG